MENSNSEFGKIRSIIWPIHNHELKKYKEDKGRGRYVDLSIDIEVILPLMTDVIVVETSIPVAIKLIQGNIPNYYANSLQTPSMSIPIE